ncbi:MULTISPECIES: sorbosone dehydrogenase family protein [unclassified Terrabacter]|uniref:PQQ-dependent sugar dehydrogenase n=1 Tax=unclassified Terrabacter TaxID=2630222 RepID=UPI0006F84520|nr:MULTISPECIES: PQQ-dependent sugar dehydrogenase [unclassified Terrabacter]KRB48155.1 glucose sorbosone dehydrogenase [Terrabacter sp. Root181]KRF40658.1 glucose sorbosone dehydrogenase [Terrabacter sp. Soil810]
MPHSSRSVGRALLGGVFVALVTAACSTAEPSAPSTGPGTSGSTTLTTTTEAGSSTSTSATPTTTRPPAAQPAGPVTLLGGLDIAWSVAVLPDGSALVSERNTGRIHHVPKPGSGGKATVAGRLPITRTEGEGGLLGLAVPEDFDADPVFYAYYSTESDNRIAAVPWRDGTIGEPVVIFAGIPRGRNHNGGRIAFGPDGYLYVGTGEAGDTSLSQNLDSLGGKILRITPDGDPAPGNPFGGSPIWSYGHRNVQGLAWDSRKRLWASEFGQNTYDELNRIEPGKNYGWPEVEGRADNPDYVDPVAQWATSEMSPSGIAVGPDGAVYMAALRGQSVWRVPVNADGSVGTPTRHLQGTYGRIRDIRFVDNRAWITTSNNDGADRLISLPSPAVGVG